MAAEQPFHLQQLQELREKLKKYCEEHHLTRPDFVELIGIPRSSGIFDACVKSLSRFENNHHPRLHPSLRARLAQFFRPEIPNFDMLDYSFYEDYIPRCKEFYDQATNFYNIRNKIRIPELESEVLGRFFLYKRPVNPHNRHLIMRSYVKVFKPENNYFIMVAEYQKATYESKDIGTQIDTDFYIGVSTKKDGVLIFMLRQVQNGAMKSVFFDTITPDYATGRITRGYGLTIETCDGYSPAILAQSRCAFQRIPEGFTPEQIDSLVDNVRPEDVDDVISNHIIGSKKE